MQLNTKIFSYAGVSIDELLTTQGGGHCYNERCLRERDRSMDNAASWAAGFAHGVCQGIGICH
ncbi:hypothetical protein G8J22_00117 [Lentilactobacillus hilgardii]|uniref:hypothetical protein n=1 Tax=Lentilactobacillus hilgardii TaxID=1588 RepID=UPI0012663F34|nr:hypothetical protein [Lentilactobacillus hilgardii]MCT3395088.1 hypothetical protein [Lentilactobacillus hilgardii]QIR08183.1 hypothetical protein G8J22_00117 [Lentilactobacillus hilgardii]